jgi:PDZ domain
MTRVSSTTLGAVLVLAAASSTVDGFTFVSSRRTSSNTQLYGLFDGVKDAFSAPAMERSTISSERETPIDRWMGWSVVSSNEKEQGGSGMCEILHYTILIMSSLLNSMERLQSCRCLTSFSFNLSPYTAPPVDFVDAMDESNYVTVQLTKPMGIVFEENDQDYGGIFVQSLKPDGAANKLTNGILQPGDQLVAVNDKKVCGMAFDDALGAIVDSPGETTTLTLFRGPAKQFYGKTGASQGWVDDFIKNKVASS